MFKSNSLKLFLVAVPTVYYTHGKCQIDLDSVVLRDI